MGQGDAALVRTAGGTTILIDAGGREAGPEVVRALREEGVRRIDLLVASHPHLDHIGGMLAVLSAFDVVRYVDPGTEHTTETYRELVRQLADRRIDVHAMRAGERIDLGDGASLVCWLPGTSFFRTVRSFENANSLVLRLSIGDVDVLFTGDAEPETLAALIDAGVDASEMLKVAHHGSRYGTSAAFVRRVRPDAAVISVGRANDYGHPHDDALRTLTDDCVRIFRTDLDGAVLLETDGLGWRVAPQKRPTLSDLARRRPDPAAARPSLGDGPFIASVRGEVFHPAGCVHVAKIRMENRMEFTTREEAEAAGLRPAGGCRTVARAADASASAVPAAGPVFASRFGKAYHPAGCRHLARVKEENRVEYPTAADAEAAGLQAANGCGVGETGTRPK